MISPEHRRLRMEYQYGLLVGLAIGLLVGKFWW